MFPHCTESEGHHCKLTCWLILQRKLHTDSKLKTWSTFFACHGHHSWGDSARRRAGKCGCCSIGLRLNIRSKVLGLRENEECGWGLWESLTSRYHSLPPLSPADILAGLLMHFRVIFFFFSGGTWWRSGFNHSHAEFESPFKFAVFLVLSETPWL